MLLLGNDSLEFSGSGGFIVGMWSSTVS